MLLYIHFMPAEISIQANSVTLYLPSDRKEVKLE